MPFEANIRSNCVRATRTNPEQNENWQHVGNLTRALVQDVTERVAREACE